jgi:hypothetical protein
MLESFVFFYTETVRLGASEFMTCIVGTGSLDHTRSVGALTAK